MFTLVYPPESPCGCGSGREFGKCCLKDNNVHITPKPLEPPTPRTKHAHRKCILSWTNNCSSKISGDHIVSKSVLKVLNEERIRLLTKGTTREHSLNSNSLKTKKLCQRHNSALSPIDAEAARFFAAFTAIHRSLENSEDSQRLIFFNGIDVERWMIKTLLMTYYARLSNITPATHNLPEQSNKLFHLDLEQPYGIYIPTEKQSGEMTGFRTESSASVMIHTTGTTVVGFSITLGGFPMTLFFHGDPEKLGILKTMTYRPKNLLFFRGECVFCISMIYPKWSGTNIWFSHGDQDAPIPINENR